MSTRTRILLNHPGGITTTGPRAVKELLILTCPPYGANSINKRLREMNELTKLDKLRKIAESLPPRYSIVFIQEPKGTRKNKSLYWQQRQQQRGM